MLHEKHGRPLRSIRHTLPALMLSALLGITAATSPIAASATGTPANISVDGKTLSFTLPAGYCKFGNSVAERDILDQMKMPPEAKVSNPVVFASAPCEELKNLRADAIDHLNHWFIIRVMGTKVYSSRDAFLTSVSGVTEKMDHAELSQRMERAINNAPNRADTRLSGLTNEPLGRDHLAFYITNGSDVHWDGGSYRSIGLLAFTLLHQSPVTVAAFEAPATPESNKRLQQIVRHVLEGLLNQ